jgi:hypothetical protein
MERVRSWVQSHRLLLVPFAGLVQLGQAELAFINRHMLLLFPPAFSRIFRSGETLSNSVDRIPFIMLAILARQWSRYGEGSLIKA